MCICIYIYINILHVYVYNRLSLVPEFVNKLLLDANALCSLAFLSPLALRRLFSAPEPPARGRTQSTGLGMQALIKSLTSLPEKEIVHNVPLLYLQLDADLPKCSLCILDHVNAHSPVTLTTNPLQKPSVTTYASTRRPGPHGPGPQSTSIVE